MAMAVPAVAYPKGVPTTPSSRGPGQTGDSFCRIFGTTALFEDAQLTTHYPTEQDYLDAVNEAVDAAVDRGFLLPVDAALIVADAEDSGIGGP